jgi:hypothetical protein
MTEPWQTSLLQLEFNLLRLTRKFEAIITGWKPVARRSFFKVLVYLKNRAHRLLFRDIRLRLQMHAMLFSNPAPVENMPSAWVELPDPVPGPGEVRLAVRCCAICRTDLHIVEGDIHPPSLPVVPGHQIVGVGLPLPELPPVVGAGSGGGLGRNSSGRSGLGYNLCWRSRRLGVCRRRHRFVHHGHQHMILYALVRSSLIGGPMNRLIVQIG